MKAIQQLKDEHAVIKTMLRIMETICERINFEEPPNDETFEKIIDFLKVFVDQCHHGKEEGILFPAMERAGIPRHGPIEVMLFEHETGRNYVKAVVDAYARYKSGDTVAAEKLSKNLSEYISLLRAHIDKEDFVLYPLGENRFSEQKDEELYKAFETLEEQKIGAGRHEAFHQMIETFMKKY